VNRVPDVLRWGLRCLAVIALAVVGMLVGLRLAGPTERETALGVVQLRVAPGLNGTVDAFIPLANWGVRAEPFSAPLVIHVEPRAIDRQAVIRAADGERTVLAAAQRDAEEAAGDALVRALLWAIGGALAAGILAALLLRRRWPALAVPLVATLVGGLALLRADSTFDAGAFETPQFYGRGAELGQLLDLAGKAEREGRAYESQVDRTISGYADLLRAGGGAAGLEPAGRRAVVVSDLHSNTLVLDTIDRLATGRPVFFVGDFAQAGTQAEANLLVPRITRLGRVVAVSGNHDSRLFMGALARAGAIVLDEQHPVQEIEGLLVAGYPDPLESRAGDPNDPDRIFSFSERPDGERAYAAAKEDLIAWFRALDPRPDVVLVHQNGLAQALARELLPEQGQSLLILTGHDHRQHVDRYGRTLVVDAGTVGAGGLFGAGKQSIGVAQLELSDGFAWPRLIDLVQLEPLSGAARADRVLPTSFGVCETDRVKCHEPDEEEPTEVEDPEG
jgi:predicted phosphodiesterase